MNKVFCIRTHYTFKKDKTYKVMGIYSIFEKDDFISIYLDSDKNIYRYRLNRSLEYNDMIGENELYFYDFFCDNKKARKFKIDKIQGC